MTRVELFEHIRRGHFLEKKSIRALARTYRVHRRTVKQAIMSAIPPMRKLPSYDGIVLTHTIKAVIDEWLQADRKAPRKQRHTAHRIYRRLLDEYDFQGAAPTIRKYVGQRRRELGLSMDVFVPQIYLAGQEAEVDWYEAVVDFPEGRRKVQFFQMRACFSGKEFHCAFPRQTQQAFIEGHIQAFLYFGGVFERIRYDNLTSAVKKVLQGRKRVETERFIALRSHYLFESVFCRPGKEGAHEKGGVEGGVGRFRRNHLVPVPQFKDYKALNAYLLEACHQDSQRQRQGHNVSVKEAWEEEASHIRPLPMKLMECHELRTPLVNHKGLVSVDSNYYSVPVRYVNRRMEVRLSAHGVSCWQEGSCVAHHERLYGKYQVNAQLDHYLELFRHKPGALKGSLPLAQAREMKQWPIYYDRLWAIYIDQLGQSSGTQALLDILFLHRRYRPEEVDSAIQKALTMGGTHIALIEFFIREQRGEITSPDPIGCSRLRHYDRKPSSLSCYDNLLTRLRSIYATN